VRTQTEWDGILSLLDNGWPGDLTAEAGLAYQTLLDDVPTDRIVQGLRQLLHAGHKWRPTAAEILGQARVDPLKPTWQEAQRLIWARGGILKAQPAPRGRWIDDEKARATNQAVAERIAATHPLVQSFVARITVERLHRVDLESEWDRKEMREAWEQHVEAMESRETIVLAAGGDPREGLRQLDPLAALGLDGARPSLPCEGAGS
jgi:hypothetical protein